MKEGKKKNAGILLFILGVGITIIAGAKLPAQSADYPDTLLYYFIGAILAIIGLFFWHVYQRAETKIKLEDELKKSTEGPFHLILDVERKLDDMAIKIASLDSTCLCREVDDLMLNNLFPFASLSGRVTNLLGVKEGSEVLIHIAYGERYLNRVWSSAADGHLHEANNACPKAHQAFREVSRKLKQF